MKGHEHTRSYYVRLALAHHQLVAHMPQIPMLPRAKMARMMTRCHRPVGKSIADIPRLRIYVVLENKGTNWSIHLVSLVVREVDKQDAWVLGVEEAVVTLRTCMVAPSCQSEE